MIGGQIAAQGWVIFLDRDAGPRGRDNPGSRPSVKWLKSLWRSNEARHIQEAGFVTSLAGESGRCGRYGDV
jgi:hypothetical protein